MKTLRLRKKKKRLPGLNLKNTNMYISKKQKINQECWDQKIENWKWESRKKVRPINNN